MTIDGRAARRGLHGLARAIADLTPPNPRRALPLVTCGVVASVVAVAIRLDVFRHDLPMESAYQWGFTGEGLLAGNTSTVWTSQFLSRDSFMAISIPLSIAVTLGPYEWLRGHVRALTVTAVSALAGPVVVALALGLGSALGVEVAAKTLATVDYGASAITAGAGGALVSVLRRRWLTVAALAFVASGLLVHREMADWEHVCAFATGAATGAALEHAGRATRVRWRGSSRSRRLLAATGSVLALAVAALVMWQALASTFPPALPGAGPVGAVATAGTVPSPPHIFDLRYPTPSTGGDRRVLVVLPAGYDGSPDRFPAIEILHGRPGNPDDIVVALQVLALASQGPPSIVFAPDGHGPDGSDTDFADSSHVAAGAAVGPDLQRWANRTFRTSSWSAMGLSAGGYGAAYLGARADARYDAVCSIGGYFEARDPVFAGESDAVRSRASPIQHITPAGPRTLLVAGRDDADAVSEADRYQTALRAAHRDVTVSVIDGGHDWSLFRAGAGRCFAFFGQTPP
jgi:enterochelin esterase-like enzyme